jgi:hypothetical protein
MAFSHMQHPECVEVDVHCQVVKAHGHSVLAQDPIDVFAGHELRLKINGLIAVRPIQHQAYNPTSSL